MPQLKKRRPTFALRSLFLAVTACALCAWNWALCERRRRASDELLQYGYTTFRDATLGRTNTEVLRWDIVYNGRRGDAMRRSVVTALLGVDNWNGLTVVIWGSDLKRDGQPEGRDEAGIDALARLPGLTTVTILDTCPPPGDATRITEFKRRIGEKLPRVKINHVHLPPLPIG